jgi:outer membrane protein insertion porin family
MALAVFATLLPVLTTSASAQTTQSAVSLTNPLAGRIVEDVQIRGNPTVPTSLIRNVIRTAPQTRYDPATVQEDYHRIFELKKFANVEAQVQPTSTGGVVVVFIVTEQKLIKKITWHGNKGVDTSALEAATDLKVGQSIDTFRISLAKQSVITTYREKNYPFAHVDVPTDPLTERGEVIFDFVEGPKVWIRNIRFLGAVHVTAEDLRSQIKSSLWIPIFNPGRYDPDQVDEDIAAIRRYYEDHGYFDVRVGRKLIFSLDQSELQIDFVINEGVRYVVDRVAFLGNSKLSDAQLHQGLNLTPGRFFDYETVQRDTKQIVKDYSPFGFIYVVPQPQVPTDDDYLRIDFQRIVLQQPGRVALLYRIHEGKPFHLGRIIVNGNYKSQDKLVRREFRDFASGDLYNSAAVEDAVDRIRATPFFSSVSATPQGNDPEYRNLVVNVTEQRTASFNLGAGVSSNGGISGTIVYQQRNFDIANIPDDWREILSDKSFTGAGQGFRASFSPGTIYSSADLRFSEPWLFDQPYQFVADLYLRDAIRENYTDRRYGTALTFGKYLDYQNSVSLTLRGEQVDIRDVQDPKFRAEEILEQEGTHPLTSVGVTFQHDTTNPGPVPYKGTTATVGVEAFGALGGDYHFQRFAAGWSGYQTVHTDLLDRRTVLYNRLNGGFITGDSVFFERWYGGDIGSIRGFRYRGVSPRQGRGNDPVGGDFYFTDSTELSFPIYQNSFRGVIFCDVGDVESDVKLGVIRTSVGAGVRFTLPFLGPAPIAIYFGVPLVRAGSDQTQFISFSFGFNQ